MRMAVAALLWISLLAATDVRAATVDLSAMTERLLPPHGFDRLRWDHLSEDRDLAWQTTGVTNLATKLSERIATVAIAVSGRVSRVLLKRWARLDWTVRLSTSGDPVPGPRLIRLRPGTADQPCDEQTTEGCTFAPSDVLRSPRLRATRICAGATGAAGYAAYRVATAAKPASLVVVWNATGPAERLSWLEIRPLGDTEELCAGRIAGDAD